MRVTPLPATNMTALNYSDDPKLDRAMVVVLASLLGALLLVLGVNSIVGCVIRRVRRFSPPVPEAAAAAPGPSTTTTTRLRKDALKQIPVVVYQSDVDVFGTECPICLGEFKQGQKVRLLPKCNHGFHLKCIDLWLLSHSSCPTCRQPLQLHAPS